MGFCDESYSSHGTMFDDLDWPLKASRGFVSISWVGNSADPFGRLHICIEQIRLAEDLAREGLFYRAGAKYEVSRHWLESPLWCNIWCRLGFSCTKLSPEAAGEVKPRSGHSCDWSHIFNTLYITEYHPVSTTLYKNLTTSIKMSTGIIK